MENKKVNFKEIIPLIVLSVMICAVVAAIVFGREDGDTRSKSYYTYFDTETVLTDYSGMGEDEFSEVCAALASALEKYHRLFDIYNEYEGVTNLATLNAAAGEGPVEISEELYRLLEYSKEIYRVTGGEVNIAMGSVLSLWHERREEALAGEGAVIPTAEELASAALHCHIDDLILDPEAMTAELRDPRMSLDVGAVAKGYTAELLADLLASRGISGFIINIGGNLRAVGEKPTGDGWLAGIRNPRTDTGLPYISEFYIRDTSLVTSGDYMRYFEVEGVKYHHIIDKDTLMPAGYFVSVSIVTKNSGLADSLSTALFTMSLEDGRELIESLAESEGIERAVWVDTEGKVTVYEP